MSYERNNIQKMRGYSYGEQPERREVIKLNTNENPYPPSPAVAEALRHFDADQLRRYPAATGARLRDTLAALHGVEANQIVLTHAGDEALRLAVTTFLPPGASLAAVTPAIPSIRSWPPFRMPGWKPFPTLKTGPFRRTLRRR